MDITRRSQYDIKMTTPILSGLKVCLCPKSVADARQDYSWQKDAELMAFSGNEPLTESFPEYLTQSLTAHSPQGIMEVFAVRTVQEGRHIGNCALYYIDHPAGEAQLGIAIGERDCWSKGYGSEAVKMLSHYAFDKLGLAKVRLKTLENNNRAKRCFEKCGFTPCGTLLHEGRHYVLMELARPSYPAY